LGRSKPVGFVGLRPKADIADADLEAKDLAFGICALGTSMGPSRDWRNVDMRAGRHQHSPRC